MLQKRNATEKEVMRSDEKALVSAPSRAAANVSSASAPSLPQCWSNTALPVQATPTQRLPEGVLPQRVRTSKAVKGGRQEEGADYEGHRAHTPVMLYKFKLSDGAHLGQAVILVANLWTAWSFLVQRVKSVLCLMTRLWHYEPRFWPLTILLCPSHLNSY